MKVLFSATLCVFLISNVWSPPAHSKEETGNEERPTLEQVLVTARRKTEPISVVPVSITAFTEEDLGRMQPASLDQIANSVPNLEIDSGIAIAGFNGVPAIFIRGVGQLDFTLNVDPAVGIYVDGVHYSRAIGSLLDLLDVKQVEVLRGPQGTMFGRNTSGGAINITTRPPSEETGGLVSLAIGEFSNQRARIISNFFTGDSVGVRVAVQASQRDGYVERLFDGDKNGDLSALSGRLSVDWRLSETSKLAVAVDGVRKREGTAPVVALAVDGDTPAPPGELPPSGFIHNLVTPGCTPFPSPLDNPDCYNAQFEAGPFNTYAGLPSKSNLDAFGISSVFSKALRSNLDFKSISAFRSSEAEFNLDVDFSPHRVFDVSGTQDFHTFSQEVHLLGESTFRQTEWILGAYYLRESGRHIESVSQSYLTFTSGGDSVNRSAAVFGQASIDLAEKLRLTAGARYTTEKRSFVPDSRVTELPLGDLGGQLPPNVFIGAPVIPATKVSQKANELTPSVALQLNLNSNSRVYAKYAEGFRSGGFSQRVIAPRPAPSFSPDKVKLKELGFKYHNTSRALVLNTAFFSNDFSNIQVLGRIPGVAGNATLNAGDAKISGFELELSTSPTPNWNFRFALGHLNARYKSIESSSQSGLSLDSEFVNTPEWTYTAAINGEHALAGGARVSSHLQISRKSGVFNDALNTPLFYQGPVTLVNCTIRVRPPKARWSLILSGKNLSDETYLISGELTQAIASGYGIFAMPRTWGIGLEIPY